VSAIETIPEYLTRMRAKDLEKHGLDCGWKSTREVAEYFGISLAKARRQLHGLRAYDVIDSVWFEGSLLWRIML
jgi:hypothetical protein